MSQGSSYSLETKDVTILDIKKAIPSQCFESDLLISVLYTFRSFFFAAVLGFIMHSLRTVVHSSPLMWIMIIVYVLLQGLVFWGFFTIGHDCGHGAFSRYPAVNWIVGNAVHSLILVPYEPWRLSHRSHHKNTCNMAKEEIFYPNEAWYHKLFFLSIGGSWFVYILFKNVPGRRSYLAYFRQEFFVSAGQLICSFVSILAVFTALTKSVNFFGFFNVFLYYLAPLFVFASWLVIVTFLHHNDSTCPWYTNETWTLLKGSLSCCDRDYGWLVNAVSHNINLHQIHHLFPVIPHYHLAEATDAFRSAFPLLSRVRTGSNIVAFLSASKDWLFTKAIPGSNGVFLYK